MASIRMEFTYPRVLRAAAHRLGQTSSKQKDVLFQLSEKHVKTDPLRIRGIGRKNAHAVCRARERKQDRVRSLYRLPPIRTDLHA